MRFTLDKLCGIRADLLVTDENWGFNELIEAIYKCTERNPIEGLERSGRTFKEQHRIELQEQSRTIQLQGKNSLPHQRVRPSTRVL